MPPCSSEGGSCAPWGRHAAPFTWVMTSRIFFGSVFLFISLVVTNCTPDTLGESEPESMGTVEQELITCGALCPPGYDFAGWACSTSCPGYCYNAVYCAPTPVYATISADPQTVSVPPGSVGTTRICWNTSGLNYPVWITVSVNGASEALFTKESDRGSYCENAPWIQAGNSYEFRIRTQQTGGTVLTSTTVYGVQGSPPPPPPDGCSSCRSGYSCFCGDGICRPNNTACP
jgi:hypothetical protein